MEKMLRCDCGFEARAADESDLVVQVQRHAVEAHGMTLSDEQALLLASRAQPSGTARSPAVARETADDASGDTKSKEEP